LSYVRVKGISIPEDFLGHWAQMSQNPVFSTDTLRTLER